MKVRGNFVVWIAGFLAFASTESSLRILLHHEAWDLQSSLVSIGASLLLAGLIGLLVSIVYTLTFITIRLVNSRATILQRALSPAIAIATAAVIPFVLNYHFFLAG